MSEENRPRWALILGSSSGFGAATARALAGEGVHIFGAAPEWKNIEKNGEILAAVQGMSYPTREVTDNLALQFSPPQSGSIFTIGLLHANVGGNSAHPNYAPCTVEDLSASGIDYWALGHVHTRQTLKRAAPVIAYPGNIQGRHPNETGERGALVVDVDPSGASKSEFVPLDVVSCGDCVRLFNLRAILLTSSSVY